MKPHKRSLISWVLIGFVFTGAWAEARDDLPPAHAFDMAALRDSSTLDLKILKDEIRPVSADHPQAIRCIELEFFSHHWGGESLRHLAEVYLPPMGISEDRKGMAVMNQGSSSNLSDGFNVARDYGALTALELGLPSMLLKSNLPGDHWGIRGQGAVRRYTAARFFDTGNPHWIHWMALAKVYMRAMTVLGELEDIQANRFVLAGSSKRAQSIWIAAAADKRVHGLVPIARPGNFLNLLQNHRADPGGLPDPADKRIEHTGSSHDYMLHVEDLHTTRGYAYMAYADPYQFLTRVNVPVMYLIGTNDRLFHSFDDHGFFPFYTGDKSFAYVANYGHGMATPTHVDALRAWVAHCFWGRPVTRLTALETGEEGVLRVRALVRSEAAITSVRLHYAVLGGPQFQDARDRYTSIPMQGLEDTLSWEVVIPGLTGEVYWYVEVADRSMGLVSTATTLLKRSFISMPGHGVGVAR